jgi:hypothetical protein
MSASPLVELVLAHLFRPDRASTSHFASSLEPIELDVAGNIVIIRVTLLKDCPALIRGHYDRCGTSEETLIFWSIDGAHHGQSLKAVQASLSSSNNSEVWDVET